MKKYKSIFESYRVFEIKKMCQYLIKHFKMEFVVIGGAAFSLYTGQPAKDLDIVVYDFGTITMDEVDKVRAMTKENVLLRANLLGVDIDFLRPGVNYEEFQIPGDIISHINYIEGIKVVQIPLLIEMTRPRKREEKIIILIKSLHLDLNFIKKLPKGDQKGRFEYLFAWEKINNKRLNNELTKDIISGKKDKENLNNII